MEKMSSEKLEKLTKTELLTIIGDLQKTLEELESETEDLAKKVEEIEKCTCEDVVKKLTSEKSVLRKLVEISCRENCPHHKNENACRNCSVAEQLKAIDGETEKE